MRWGTLGLPRARQRRAGRLAADAPLSAGDQEVETPMSFIMPFDPRGFHWTSPAGSVGQFRPTWPVQIFAWRESEPEPTEYRPAARRMKVARIVTGAGSRETAETVDTLVRAVRRVGAKSFADERGTPFFVTPGPYALWSG